MSMELFQDAILDSIYEMDPDQLPCPRCGCTAEWSYLSTQTQRFSWEASHSLVYLRLPILSFHCRTCGCKGAEMVTTDLTIGKSELSFHYLFELIREKNVLNVDVVHKESVLYERISHDSLNRWIQRFNRDFTAYRTNNGNVSSELILNEEINFGEMFRVFFLQTGRFFLHDHKTEVIIV